MKCLYKLLLLLFRSRWLIRLRVGVYLRYSKRSLSISARGMVTNYWVLSRPSSQRGVEKREGEFDAKVDGRAGSSELPDAEK